MADEQACSLTLESNEWKALTAITFWIEGVLSLITVAEGLLANIVVGIILSKQVI